MERETESLRVHLLRYQEIVPSSIDFSSRLLLLSPFAQKASPSPLIRNPSLLLPTVLLHHPPSLPPIASTRRGWIVQHPSPPIGLGVEARVVRPLLSLQHRESFPTSTGKSTDLLLLRSERLPSQLPSRSPLRTESRRIPSRTTKEELTATDQTRRTRRSILWARISPIFRRRSSSRKSTTFRIRHSRIDDPRSFVLILSK